MDFVYETITILGSLAAMFNVFLVIKNCRPKISKIIPYIKDDFIVLVVRIEAGTSACLIKNISVKGCKVAKQAKGKNGEFVNPDSITRLYEVLRPEISEFSDSVPINWEISRDSRAAKSFLIVCIPSCKLRSKLSIRCQIANSFRISKTIAIDIKISPTETQNRPKRIEDK